MPSMTSSSDTNQKSLIWKQFNNPLFYMRSNWATLVLVPGSSTAKKNNLDLKQTEHITHSHLKKTKKLLLLYWRFMYVFKLESTSLRVTFRSLFALFAHLGYTLWCWYLNRVCGFLENYTFNQTLLVFAKNNKLLNWHPI